MSNKNKKNLSREEAAELYRDLRKVMGTVTTKKGAPAPKGAAGGEVKDLAKSIAESISKSMSKDKNRPIPESVKTYAAAETEDAIVRMELGSDDSEGRTGQYAAVAAVLFFAMFKVVLGVVDAAGGISLQDAQASMDRAPLAAVRPVAATPGNYSKEEVRVLTMLDARRAELEEKSRRIEEREIDITRRDREFATKLTQLRELTDTLKVDREKNEKKRSAQLDQLANVYGSMAPNEAAALMEQLDITIALSLVERMPEKRIGQILALMSPERALAMTRMLSGKAER